jgi:hypothetical protein
MEGEFDVDCVDVPDILIKGEAVLLGILLLDDFNVVVDEIDSLIDDVINEDGVGNIVVVISEVGDDIIVIVFELLTEPDELTLFTNDFVSTGDDEELALSINDFVSSGDGEELTVFTKDFVSTGDGEAFTLFVIEFDVDTELVFEILGLDDNEVEDDANGDVLAELVNILVKDESPVFVIVG